MIKARKIIWAERLFQFYMLRLLKKSFYSFYTFGEIPKPQNNLPTILLPNHSTWWDGFFVYLLNHCFFKRRTYLMMLEEHLSKHKFFSKIGVFSINPNNPKSTIKTLNYTAELLKNQKNGVPQICIFPQGELLAWGTRPLQIKKGIEVILKKYKSDVNLILVGIKVESIREQLPEVFFNFSGSSTVNYENFSFADFENKLGNQLEKLNHKIIYERETAKPFYSGKKSLGN